MKVLGEKVGKLGLDELVVAGLSKYAGEKLFAMTPVGNGTLVSGAVKIGTAIGTKWFAGDNKWVKASATGIGIDGIEDILNSVFSGNFLGQQSSSRSKI